MTIDSSWLASFKEEAPQAFQPSCSFRPSAVFCDGQIHLMQGAPVGPQTLCQTWDKYIWQQFHRPLQKFFSMCDTVVLAFDNYAHVPVAKAMTQTKRKKNVPRVDFAESQSLPCMVPEGEKWTSCIANRAFKAKVIELVVSRLPSMILQGHPGKKLIVDYQEPVVFTWSKDGTVTQEAVDGLTPLGEADVKFVRYADLFQKLLVDSIDGDTVPIALLHHETCLARETCPPRVSVYRMEIKTGDAGEKRKKGRTYEYLDVCLLYQCLRTSVLQSSGRTLMPSHAGHEVRMLISLIALTGTDFSRNFPYITGRSVFELLPQIWMTLCSCYDPLAGQLDVHRTPDSLVALLYHLKYAKHVPCKHGVQSVLSHIHASKKISELTKSRLPTPERVSTTVRNVNWVLQYWKCEEPCPDPVSLQFGYVMVRGVPHYADAV